MALHDGFFDAIQSEETGKYDREYGADDFTNYFANIIGSGVCVHNDPDSFLVRVEGGSAIVSPGCLFIDGYWLKNDADYTVSIPGSGTYAIVAHLNLGARMIELEARAEGTSYTDCLVLAMVSPGSAEDTRYSTDICGVIDTAGELYAKVQWALGYIDDEIEGKLEEVEDEIHAQSAKLKEKIAEAQGEADKIKPSPVGTIKFSAEPNVAANWMRCDGSTVSKADYPALVAALQELQGGSGNTAQLPDLSIGGVPGYIKAFTDDDMVDLSFEIYYSNAMGAVNITVNGEILPDERVYTRSVPKNGNFTVGLRSKASLGYNKVYLLINDTTTLAYIDANIPDATVKLKVSDYVSSTPKFSAMI